MNWEEEEEEAAEPESSLLPSVLGRVGREAFSSMSSKKVETGCGTC